MIIEISVAIIALAFLALVIYLIGVAISLRQTLNTLNGTLQEVHHFATQEEHGKKLLKNVTLISSNLLDKMNALDSTFHTFTNIGNYFEQKTHHLQQEAKAFKDNRYSKQWSSYNERDFPNLAKIADAVELIWVGIKMFNRFNNNR